MMPAMMALQGAAGIATGLIGGGKRRAELQAAKDEFEKAKTRMEGLDTSNLYENLENPYEDLTVNTQQADFMAQQQNAALANTMGGMQAAAGGSGIAALAQAMANQQSKNMQAASASIGAQESAINQKIAGGAMQLQSMERQGASQARNLEMNKSRFMFDQASQRMGAAQQAQQAAMNQIAGGVGQMGAGALAGYAQSEAGQEQGGFWGGMLGNSGG